MIPRYALAPMAELFADEARYATWLEVELLAVEAQAKLGVIPADAAAAIRDRAGFDVEAIEARERVTDHDVAAFVDVVQERVGPPHGAWVHHGLTSSDVVDTALSVTLVRATDLLLGAVDELDAAIVARAREHRATPMVGRTHGIHAEPTTFGAKLALWALQLRRDRARLVRARSAVAVGKLSGAVGTYSNVDPEVEAFVCERLGLEPVPATQVHRPRPPRRAALRVRVARRGRSRPSRSRSATSSAPRCARSRSRSAPASRRARARCRTSATR